MNSRPHGPEPCALAAALHPDALYIITIAKKSQIHLKTFFSTKLVFFSSNFLLTILFFSVKIKVPQKGEREKVMRKLNYLSDEFIEIDDKMEYKNSVDFSSYLKEVGWNDCQVGLVEGKNSWMYYKINFKNGKVITIRKESSCHLRKITNGLLKGCYCIIESQQKNNTFTLLYVFDEKDILRYPEFNKVLTAEEIDNLFKRENIEYMTAKLLNKFNISKNTQFYEIFCENLPQNCWKDGKFKTNVLNLFEKMGEVELSDETNKEFIRTDLCKERALKYFKKLSNQKESLIAENREKI